MKPILCALNQIQVTESLTLKTHPVVTDHIAAEFSIVFILIKLLTALFLPLTRAFATKIMSKSSSTSFYDGDMVRISRRLHLFKLAVRNSEPEIAQKHFFAAFSVSQLHESEKQAITVTCLGFIVKVACSDIELGNVRLVNTIIFLMYDMITGRIEVDHGIIAVVIERMCLSKKSCLIGEIIARAHPRKVITTISDFDIVACVGLIDNKLFLSVMLAHRPVKYSKLFNIIYSLYLQSKDLQPLLRYGLALCHCLKAPPGLFYAEFYKYIKDEMEKPVLVIASRQTANNFDSCQEKILRAKKVVNVNPKTFIFKNPI